MTGSSFPYPNRRALTAAYQVLGLEPGASPEEIKHAYHELVKVWHPDRYSHDLVLQKQAGEKLVVINEAYAGLQAHLAHPDGLPPPLPPYRPRPSAPVTPKRRRSSRLAWPYRYALALVLLGIGVAGLLYLAGHFLTPPAAVESSLPAPLLPALPALPPGDIAEQPATSKTSPAFFTLGSSEAEVLAAQGPPTAAYGATWMYGQASVKFFQGRVVSYDNRGGELRVHLSTRRRASGQAAPEFFSLGDSPEEVVSVQGTPTAVQGSSWLYGLSTVEFSLGKVTGYSNLSGNLRIRLLPQTRRSAVPPHFSLGSTQDEVLAVQGTPTTVYGQTWFYGSSQVRFQNGKVVYYDNIGENLRLPRS